ncbi:hypothetical protein CROQUDRAFT_691971 [Cronartium quercuum f. sp. fusiforme G11]|uniref:Carboxylic ester hydrolase n=1 Tax=Cronartium quercuum f. sp. fusiforme G11 TaxID=708437 RepID=A0A9P6NKM4_9BASI|nr:hypothetical protein CROQUDRAFT_691971 [Cronartium quercuum f. sp. fusiforme G11]
MAMTRNILGWNTAQTFILAVLLVFIYPFHFSNASHGRVHAGQTPLSVINDVLFDHHLQINTTSGVFTGLATHLTTSNPIDIWLGIPYAEKPIGALRFKAPIPLIHPHQKSVIEQAPVVKTAWEFGDACPQPASSDIPVPISEDCLSLNIYRPAKPVKRPSPLTSDKGTLLPVLVWIHGGGLSYGSSAEYDGSTIVSHSHEMGKPILLITLNYRLNSYGFLNTDTLPVEDLSVGLKDQLAALSWIQVNIAAFGGDPQKVTLWGQSAGGFSVSLLMTYLTQSQRLFRAAIMDSGAPTSHTVPPVAVYDLPELPYNLLLKFTGCDESNNGKATSQSSLECLRSLPTDVLTNATTKVSKYGPYPKQVSVWGPCWKNGAFVDKRPSKRLQEGDFLNMPVLMGTNKDEGTVFAIRAANDAPAEASDQYMFAYMSNSSILDFKVVDPKVYQKVAEIYPDVPKLGSPYGTGNQTFGLPSSFKRLASWFGDLHYQAPRRLWSSKTSPRQDTYVYFFNGPRNTSDPSYRGVPHSSEILLIFGRGWYQDLDDEEKVLAHRLAKKMRTYYINFVNDLNPGGDWPLYKPSSRRVMKLDKYNTMVIDDDWRVEQIAYLNSQEALDTFYT